MSRAGVAAAGALVALSACTYYNSIYNAETLYVEAERQRLAGRDSVASELYHDVVRKAAQGFRREPDGPWAFDALSLLGRAHLWSGDPRAARAALEEAVDRAGSTEQRLGVQVYLAIVLAENGEAAESMRLLNQSLQGDLEPATRGAGHLQRATLLFQQGRRPEGLWDLDRAIEADGALRVQATVESLRWSVLSGDRPGTSTSVGRLLAHPDAGERVDTVIGLVRVAAERWGPRSMAELLAASDSARWSRLDRGRLGLERARLLHLAGDSSAAAEQAEEVARGLGGAAAQARLQLAAWRLATARGLDDIYGVRAILLPASSEAAVAEVLRDTETLDRYAFLGVREPLAWFLAGEVARERLGAPMIARAFFLAYAGQAPDEPWAPKALLAALTLSLGEGDRAWLRGRLEAHRGSPYVLAAMGRPATGFEALEVELAERLREMRNR